jgi:hypothetical protein
MYTEALGRAPDESGWLANISGKPQSGSACLAQDFTALANGFYASAEYSNLGYTSIEKVSTLYRGLLNREPDTSGGLQYWANQLDSGVPIATVIASFTATSEFASLKNQICSTSGNVADPVYRWGQAPAITIDGTITAAALNNLLAAAATSSNKTVSLAPRTIVYANVQIKIPAGVTLTTSGVTNRQQYLRMARIVRTAHFDDASVRGGSSLVSMESGAKVNALWISGQREAAVPGASLVHKPFSPNIFIRGGTGSSVINSRLDTSTGDSVLGIDGVAEGSPCFGAVIGNNLITGYLSTHYNGKYTDGITVACEDATVSGNHVVDASDVGIILFRSASKPQKSKVLNNIVVSAGVSAFAAVAFEPYSSPVAFQDFSGASIANNRFWTSGDSHFDIGIAVGTKAWSNTNNVGGGASVTNNTNGGVASIMQVGIGIDGMINTIVSGNQLNYVRQANGLCPTKAAVVVNPDSSRATPGAIAAGTTFVYGALNGCQMGLH